MAYLWKLECVDNLAVINQHWANYRAYNKKYGTVANYVGQSPWWNVSDTPDRGQIRLLNMHHPNLGYGLDSTSTITYSPACYPSETFGDAFDNRIALYNDGGFFEDDRFYNLCAGPNTSQDRPTSYHKR